MMSGQVRRGMVAATLSYTRWGILPVDRLVFIRAVHAGLRPVNVMLGIIIIP